MDIGNLKDSLIDAAKEKGKEAAEDFLDQKAEGGGIVGQGAGIARDALGSVFGGGEEQGEERGEDRGEDSSEDSSSDEDSGDNDENN